MERRYASSDFSRLIDELFRLRLLAQAAKELSVCHSECDFRLAYPLESHFDELRDVLALQMDISESRQCAVPEYEADGGGIHHHRSRRSVVARQTEANASLVPSEAAIGA